MSARRVIFALPLLLAAPALWANTVVITQSCDTSTITPGNSIACTSTSGPFFTRQNSFLRRFRLASSHAIFSFFSVSSVRFGIEIADDGLGSAGQTITVNVYSIPTAAPFLFANMTLLGTQSIVQTNATDIFVDVPVTGFIADGQAEDLVVEVFAPDGATDEAQFFIGTNKGGQSAPSYNAAPDVGCFGSEPVDYAAGGFPDAHIVMEVTGDKGGGDPATNSSCTPQEGKKAPEALCGKVFFSAQSKAEKSKAKALSAFTIEGCDAAAAADVGAELDEKLQPLATKANAAIDKLGGLEECDPALQVTLPVDLTDLLDGAATGEDFLNNDGTEICDDMPSFE